LEERGQTVNSGRGEDEKVKKAISLIESIKGDPVLKGFKGTCEKCAYACMYAGKKLDQLPKWLKD
jgi:hypothetical protein